MVLLYEWDEDLLFKSRAFVKMSNQETENRASRVITGLCYTGKMGIPCIRVILEKKNKNSVIRRV